ncbi:hypothetical protein WJX75_007539 [Coccomyxa subellipsoidea]|uniref:DUF2834 domain-containing protein n=1 Tax=Coccomyxa subellipsoidea TaxID=248742 RepID=A0ABR2Z4E2_9CHLO
MSEKVSSKISSSRRQVIGLTPKPSVLNRQRRLHAGRDDTETEVQERKTTEATVASEQSYNLISAAVGLLFWAAFVGYALLLSPNQTPYRDMYFLEKLTGLGVDDGVQINAVFTQLFFMMGLWPAIYAALLIPSARSGNKIPAWPFVALSFGVGVFGLGPYFALWTPSREAVAPPKPEELEGWNKLALKGTESKIGAWLIFAGAVATIAQAALAGGEAWSAYWELFVESRFVHVTTTDFAALSLFAPFWMWNDAEKRQWQGRERWLPLLSLLPFLGPAIYLTLRPKAGD